MGVRAVVTGGSKNIGASIVEELAKKGAKILTCGRNDRDLKTKLAEWTAKGYDVEGVSVDISTVSGRFSFADAIRRWLSGHPLDILVNNVGRRPSTRDCGNGENEEIWASNFHSMFMLTTICREHLKRQDMDAGTRTSCVVNIASVVGFSSLDTHAPYPAAKAAVIKTTSDWACEWAADGIRVNCVAPGLMQTEETNQMTSPAAGSKEGATSSSPLQQSPLGRFGGPMEVSGLVTFLCLPLGGFITGQVICVDGGYSRTEYYDEVSAKKLRAVAEDIAMSRDILKRLALPSPESLDEFCKNLESISTTDDSVGEKLVDAQQLDDQSTSNSIRAEITETDVKWEEWKSRRRNNSTKRWEDRKSKRQTINGNEESRDDTPTKNLQGPNTKQYRQEALVVPSEIGLVATRPQKILHQSRKASSKKRVSFRDLTEDIPLAPKDELNDIDEGIEADIGGRDSVDIPLVKSFRDRLKRIQERKKSRRSSILERSKSLRCAFSSAAKELSMDYASLASVSSQFSNKKSTGPSPISGVDQEIYEI